MQMLEQQGIPTHFVKELSDRETVVKRVEIVPLEVIVRNISAGHFAQNYGWRRDRPLTSPPLSFPIKMTRWGTPHQFLPCPALKLATGEGDRHHRPPGLSGQRGSEGIFPVSGH